MPTRHQAIIWTNAGYFTDAYIRHPAQWDMSSPHKNASGFVECTAVIHATFNIIGIGISFSVSLAMLFRNRWVVTQPDKHSCMVKYANEPGKIFWNRIMILTFRRNLGVWVNQVSFPQHNLSSWSVTSDCIWGVQSGWCAPGMEVRCPRFTSMG